MFLVNSARFHQFELDTYISTSVLFMVDVNFESLCVNHALDPKGNMPVLPQIVVTYG